MKKILFLMFAALFGCGIARAQSDVEASTCLKEGMEVPAVTVRMLDGSTVQLAELKGKVVLVNFWATWCPPCRKEIARMQKDVVERFAGEEDFVLLAVAIDDASKTVKSFMERNGYTFPVAFDGGQRLYRMFAEKYVPRNFVIGRDGKVAFYTVGYTPEEFDALIGNIDALLKEK